MSLAYVGTGVPALSFLNFHTVSSSSDSTPVPVALHTATASQNGSKGQKAKGERLLVEADRERGSLHDSCCVGPLWKAGNRTLEFSPCSLEP